MILLLNNRDDQSNINKSSMCLLVFVVFIWWDQCGAQTIERKPLAWNFTRLDCWASKRQIFAVVGLPTLALVPGSGVRAFTASVKPLWSSRLWAGGGLCLWRQSLSLRHSPTTTTHLPRARCLTASNGHLDTQRHTHKHVGTERHTQKRLDTQRHKHRHLDTHIYTCTITDTRTQRHTGIHTQTIGHTDIRSQYTKIVDHSWGILT